MDTQEVSTPVVQLGIRKATLLAATCAQALMSDEPIPAHCEFFAIRTEPDGDVTCTIRVDSDKAQHVEL